ncbi:unnamed protein product [Pieris brassicae]|uniref:Uncharacterized protein n=1 Tax=Pieris brassicae TaxID=7116 RepID=A0A9P0XDI8_PIEBR|nr:unnamed protein product [Pieris brassicae]
MRGRKTAGVFAASSENERTRRLESGRLNTEHCGLRLGGRAFGVGMYRSKPVRRSPQFDLTLSISMNR